MKNWFELYVGMLFVLMVIRLISPEGKHEKLIVFVSSVIFTFVVIAPVLSLFGSDEWQKTFAVPASYENKEFGWTVSENDEKAYRKFVENGCAEALSSDFIENARKEGISGIKKAEFDIDFVRGSESLSSIEGLKIIINEDTDEQETLLLAMRLYSLPKENIYILRK